MEISVATAAPVLINLGALATVWWRLDAKMESRLTAIDQKFDRKFDNMNQTLLTLAHDVGELKGQVGSLQSRMDSLQGQMNSLQSRMDSLQK